MGLLRYLQIVQFVKLRKRQRKQVRPEKFIKHWKNCVDIVNCPMCSNPLHISDWIRQATDFPGGDPVFGFKDVECEACQADGWLYPDGELIMKSK